MKGPASAVCARCPNMYSTWAGKEEGFCSLVLARRSMALPSSSWDQALDLTSPHLGVGRAATSESSDFNPAPISRRACFWAMACLAASFSRAR